MDLLKINPEEIKANLKSGEEWPYIQAAYGYMVRSGAFDKTIDDLEEDFGELGALIILAGSMNYQVENGGLDQWLFNGYGDWFNSTSTRYLGVDEIIVPEEIVELLKEIGIAGSASFYINWLNSINFERGEEDCPECGGSGYIVEYEEDEDGEEIEEEYTCNECGGSGYIEGEDIIVTDEEEMNQAYYNGIGDKFMGILEEVTKNYIETDSIPEEYKNVENSPSEEPKKKRIKVKLVGTDGNVFSLMGKVSRALRNAGQREEAAKFVREVQETAKSYDEALQIMMKYVDIY